MPSDPEPRPIVGVSMMIWRGDRVLLIERGRDPLKGRWALPGGKQENGETWQAAVRREAREETGLEVSDVRLVDVIDRFADTAGVAAKVHYTLIVSEVTVDGGEPIPGDDAADLRWVALDELAGYDLVPGLLAQLEDHWPTR